MAAPNRGSSRRCGGMTRFLIDEWRDCGGHRLRDVPSAHRSARSTQVERTLRWHCHRHCDDADQPQDFRIISVVFSLPQRYTVGCSRTILFIRECQVKPLLAILLLLTWVKTFSGQENGAVNPYKSPEDIAAGGHIFRSHCLGCHGRDGTGGRGPDLTRADLGHGNTDQELADVIAGGIPGTEMPDFFFNGRQLWQIVAFVRSIRRPSPQFQMKGNPQSGGVLFRGKGACLQCHQVNGQGGRLGPDLTQVGARRSPDHLKASLLQPNQYVSPLDRRVQAVTREGKQVTGVRLNEDTHSVQLLDSNQNLISLRKGELKEYRLDRNSSMPSYKGVFSDGELDDLVSYLQSLRPKETRQ